MRLITLEQLLKKLAGRSRNTTYSDIEKGLLPQPKKFSRSQSARNYWGWKRSTWR